MWAFAGASTERIPARWKNCTAVNKRYPHGVGKVRGRASALGEGEEGEGGGRGYQRVVRTARFRLIAPPLFCLSGLDHLRSRESGTRAVLVDHLARTRTKALVRCAHVWFLHGASAVGVE